MWTFNILGFAACACPEQVVPDFDAETHRNVMRQLNSLREVTRLWEAEARQEAAPGTQDEFYRCFA